MGLGAGVHHTGAESFETVFQKVRFFANRRYFFASFAFAFADLPLR